MNQVLVRGWENFVARTEGPLHFRFVIQPVVSVVLAIRAGLRDARYDRPAFLWSLFAGSRPRADLVREGAADIGKLLIVAMILDAAYQLLELGAVYTLELLFTAAMLAIVPYVLVRGLASRIASRVISWSHPTTSSP